MQTLQSIIQFIIEIEKLKQVSRKTQPIGLTRFENSAEHSWQVCLCALMLGEYANEKVDVNKVIKMLLLHDLGEIDAGDTLFYASSQPSTARDEKNGFRRIIQYLPSPLADECLSLYEEFEQVQTAEARFAKAIDRLPPLLQNLLGQGHSWRQHDISADTILQANALIGEGSMDLWQYLKSELNEAFAAGILNEPEEIAYKRGIIPALFSRLA
ncbi:MAG: HD domain-containing protein [Gammaproteobacteria bacterium]|nr:HD domain-containing protein [Gammaproteobacteria bacterium]